MSNSNYISAEARAKRIAEKIAQRNKTQELVSFLDASLEANKNSGWGLNDLPSQDSYMLKDKLDNSLAKANNPIIELVISGHHPYQTAVAAAVDVANHAMAIPRRAIAVCSQADEENSITSVTLVTYEKKTPFKGFSYNWNNFLNKKA